ncbi:MAG: cytochrome c oxidase accessory protein CcoG, partial [Hyphomicrobium sp.]|nr:cytochrome c oxidase accessory protein CcoG [Hyphomicrobium sp.]
LIAYDTIAKQEASARGITHEPIQLLRPRTLLYFAMISLVGIIMLVALWNRTTLELNIQHDRNPPFVRLSEGGIRNAYTVKILNKLHEPRTFALTLRDLPGAALSMVGANAGEAMQVTVPTNTLRELRVFVTVPREGLPKLRDASTNFAFEVRDTNSGQMTRRGTLFQAPPQGGRP